MRVSIVIPILILIILYQVSVVQSYCEYPNWDCPNAEPFMNNQQGGSNLNIQLFGILILLTIGILICFDWKCFNFAFTKTTYEFFDQIVQRYELEKIEIY